MKRIAIAALLLAVVAVPVQAQCTWTATSTTLTTPCNTGVNATPATNEKLKILGDTALRIETTNSNTYAVIFKDTLAGSGFVSGIGAEFGGNSYIKIANMQLGLAGTPVIFSTGLVGGLYNPLYLNLYQPADVIVGNPSHNTGLRVQSIGASSFAGRVGIGVTAPGSPLHILSAADFGAADVLDEKSANVGVGYTLKRVQSGGSYNESWSMWMPSSSKALNFYGGGANRFVIQNDGNVAIGLGSTTYRLDVGGTAHVAQALTVDQSIAAATSVTAATMSASTSVTAPTVNASTSLTTPSISAGSINATGNIVANGTITGAVFQDVAEWVPATRQMPAGTVVVLDRDHNNQVMPSAHAYDTAVAGVVSAQPGLLLGAAGASKAMIATTGRVKVHVDATRGSIGIGDLLVTSDEEGTAMKSVPIDLAGIRIHRPGTVIGKALEPLPDGKDEILVLLSLQ